MVYSGLANAPYSSVELDYANGALSQSIYDFTDVTGQNYYAYQVTENASGAALQETLDNNDGSHLILGLSAGQTFTSLGVDTMTGDGGANTFVLNAAYGADTITNFNSDDTVSLSALEFSQLGGAIAGGNYTGGNATLSFSDGDTLTFMNMTKAQLTALSSHFVSQG